MKRIALVREAASASIPGIEKFAVDAARRVVRLQEKRRKLRRELRSVDAQLRTAKRDLRSIARATVDTEPLDTPLAEIDGPARSHE